jgi:hypothetical protein
MSSINAVSDRPFRIRARIEGAGWIHSPAFDSLLLIFAPLLTLPIIVAIYFNIPLLAIGGGLTLAFSHYFSTVSFYFWDENREYHRTRWLAFFVGPAILAGVYFLLLGFEVPYVIQFILFFWNTFHVSRQNCGILAIYRNRAGIVDPEQRQRHAANRAIIATSTFLAVWNIDTHKEVSALFALVSSDFGVLVKIATGGIAAFFTARLGLALLRRKEPLDIPETLFLGSSLVFFWPYLYIKDSGVATYAMLLPHYVQYLSLVWLLHRRKFGGASEGAPVALLRISAKLVLLIPALFAVGFGFYLLREFFDNHGYEWHFETLYLLIALEHFYLDGLIWSFRRPHIRQTILPFLLRRSAKASA